MAHNGRVLSHVDIRVSDLDASLRFYDSVLGKQRTVEPEIVDWGHFAIVADGKPVTKHLNIAFWAPSDEVVDLRDPDGNRVETVSGADRQPGGIAHLWLSTRDVGSIRRFYVATGHSVGIDEPDRLKIVTPNASVSYVAGEPVTEHVHFAFGVATTEAVDAFHRAAIDAGYTDNGAPGERLHYHPGYYGAFVLDPDGHNVEAVTDSRLS